MGGQVGRGGRALVAAVVAAVVGMLLGLLAAPGAAHAATSPLQVSSDGITFSSSLGGALFTGQEPLVPLESTAASLWVRNASPDAAQLRVSIAQLQSSSAALASSVTLTTLDAASGSGSTASLDTLASCSVVLGSRAVAPGQTVRIDFAIAMLDVDEQIAQAQLGRIDLLVALRDGAAGPFPASACDDVGVIVPTIPDTTPDSSVPGTSEPGGVAGSTVAGGTRSGSLVITGADSAAAFTIAGGLLVVGLVLLLRRRRRDESEQA